MNSTIKFLSCQTTKPECIKHKKAVDELRQRRANGETSLLIRDGVVLKRHLRLSPSTSQNSNKSSASLTSQNSNQFSR